MFCDRIETERFYLRSLTPSDATDRYLSWFKQDIIQKYIVSAANYRNISDLRQYIQEKSNKMDLLFLGIFTLSNNLHIGNLKYEPVDTALRYAVLGILIGESQWQGLGVAPEVISASNQWLFQNFGIDTFVLGVDRQNLRAVNVYKRIGFCEKETDVISINKNQSISMVLRFSNTT